MENKDFITPEIDFLGIGESYNKMIESANKLIENIKKGENKCQNR